MTKIKILTGTLELTGVEEYNRSYNEYLESTQSIWYEGDELIKKITSKFIQDPNIKNLEKISFNDRQHLFTFEIDNVYYISNRIYPENKTQVVIKSDGRYSKTLNSGQEYDSATKSYLLVLNESLIDKTFTDYKEFLEEITKIKIQAKEEISRRELYCKHIDLLYDLRNGNFPKLGKLSVKNTEGIVYRRNCKGLF